MDVENAFLHGNIEEVKFMECPPEMTDVEEDNVLALNKCICGLLQAAGNKTVS